MNFWNLGLTILRWESFNLEFFFFFLYIYCKHKVSEISETEKRNWCVYIYIYKTSNTYYLALKFSILMLRWQGCKVAAIMASSKHMPLVLPKTQAREASKNDLSSHIQSKCFSQLSRRLEISVSPAGSPLRDNPRTRRRSRLGQPLAPQHQRPERF